MSKPYLVDLLRRPNGISSGDIIGIQRIPRSELRVILGSTRLPSEDQFNVSAEKPSKRALVLNVIYDAEDKDTIKGLLLMPMIPYDRSLHVKNNDKNLMIARPGQIKNMGLDNSYNWRLNYTPFLLPITKSYLGTNADAMVLKCGRLAPELVNLVNDHTTKIGGQGILETMGVLRDNALRRSMGSKERGYENFVGGQAGRTFQGNKSDAAIIAEAEARRAAEVRAQAKATKLDTARALRDSQKSTPSGKLAFKCHVQFNAQANPDISLQTAYSIGLLGDDDMKLLVLEEVGKKSGLSTIRTLYDAFISQHGKIQADLIDTGACMEDEVISYKAEIEQTLKASLISFYDKLKRSGVGSEEISNISVPYSPALPEPAAK